MVPSPRTACQWEVILSLAAPSDKIPSHPQAKEHLRRGTVMWPAVILSGQCLAAEGRLLGLSNRAESRKEGMSAGKQLIMGQRCKQAVRERGKDLGPGLSRKPQISCHHDGMAGLALSAALCGFRGLAVTNVWTRLGGLCTHQEGEVAMPVPWAVREALSTCCTSIWHCPI